MKRHCRVWIIALHFANCEVNLVIAILKLLMIRKMRSSFFSQRKFNLSTLYFSPLYPHYIHILFHHPLIYCYQKKYYLYPKLHRKMQIILSISYTKRFAYGGLKASLRSAHLLRSELQTIFQTLHCETFLFGSIFNFVCP